MFQWIYHTNTKNSLHRAQSLQVTTGQGIEAKAKASGLQGQGQTFQGQGHDCFVLERSQRSRTVLKDPIPVRTMPQEICWHNNQTIL